DLQRRRRRQSRARRILRDRRLRRRDSHPVCRLLSGGGAVASRGRPPPHRLGRGAPLGGDAAKPERRGDRRRLPVLALPAGAARRRRRGARRHLAAHLSDRIRPRRARRHPAARHGGGARHPPAALHDHHRRARRGHGGAGRCHVRADHHRAPGDGRRDHHRRLRRRRYRRPRQFLGRGARGRARRRRARHHHQFRSGGGRSLDLRPHVPGAAVPAARAARRAHREIRMKTSLLSKYQPLLFAVAGLLLLPPAMHALGLSLNTASMVVILAIATMGLNLCVGYTGLVSFGHSTWFGIGAYAAGLIQLHWFPGEIWLPLLLAMVVVAISSTLVGILILRRRGVYFSLLTLALAALTYTTAFRWSEVTGGEDGLGGLKRGSLFRFGLDDALAYYVVVAVIGLGVLYLLLRLVRSPFGHVLVAIRENQLRATFQGYPVERYKLGVFVISAVVTGF